jgi:hypothetical protein
VTTSEAITFQNSSGSDFDYVCDGCGKSSIELFTCCGEVAWHDDVMALRKMRLTPQGIEHMAKLGVFEIDGPEADEPGWMGINYQKGMYYTWAGMYQNRERMDNQYEKLLDRIEELEKALEKATSIISQGG